MCHDRGMKRLVHLTGKRIVLREWQTDEVDAMHRWLGNPKVTHFISWGSAKKVDTASQLAIILAEQQAEFRKKYFLAIEFKATDRTIGDAGFTWIEENVAEIGYFLEPEYWGNGYATEAASMAIDLAFDLGAHTVVAACDARNTASERVMQRCGMFPLQSNSPKRRCYGLKRRLERPVHTRVTPR
ncbi:MAG: GNAT family N-acetyltransferase [Alphaproteobacteria bacterium]